MSTATLTVAEAAEELRVNKMSVYRLIWSGALATTNIGTGKRARLRISRTTLDRFLESRESRGAR